MAVFSPLSSRRSAKRKAETTQQLIVFHLCNEGFALPIGAVQKVIPMGKVYGAQRGGGVSLTIYQNQELVVIDAVHRIFREIPSQYSLPSATSTESFTYAEVTDDNPNSSALVKSPDVRQEQSSGEADSRYLLLLKSSQGKLVGVSIEKPPSLQRVPVSAFTPLTPEYAAEGNLRCVSALVIYKDNAAPLFLLNPDLLVKSPQALPSGF